MTEYQKELYNQQLEICKQLNSFTTGYTFQLVEQKNDPNYFNIELVGKYDIVVSYSDYQKKYHFGLWQHNKYVNNYDDGNYRDNHPMPQNVGVLNANKIKAWIDYLVGLAQAMEELSAERVAKVEAFLREFEEKTKGAEVRQWNDKHNGEAVRNGVIFKYEIGDTGYISQKVEIHWQTKETLDTFNQLSNNKYIKPQD